ASLTFTVIAVPQNPVPVLATVTPTTLPISSVDTQIAITGSSFIASSSVAIDAQGIPTLFVSATEPSATVPASYLSAPGPLHIDAVNPAPGGGFSAVRIPINVGATSADDGGTDALVDAADAAPPGSCNVSGHIYLNGAIAYPSTMTACGALTPG